MKKIHIYYSKINAGKVLHTLVGQNMENMDSYFKTLSNLRTNKTQNKQNSWQEIVVRQRSL